MGGLDALDDEPVAVPEHEELAGGGDAGSRTVRTGARWQVDPETVIGLEGTRQTSGAREETDNQLMLRLALRF